MSSEEKCHEPNQSSFQMSFLFSYSFKKINQKGNFACILELLLFYFIGTVEVPLLQLITIDFDWKLSSVLDELIWKMYCHGNPPTVVVFLGMIHRKIDVNFNEN